MFTNYFQNQQNVSFLKFDFFNKAINSATFHCKKFQYFPMNFQGFKNFAGFSRACMNPEFSYKIIYFYHRSAAQSIDSMRSCTGNCMVLNAIRDLPSRRKIYQRLT